MLSSHIDQIIKNSNKKLLVKAADYIDFISIIDDISSKFHNTNLFFIKIFC